MNHAPPPTRRSGTRQKMAWIRVPFPFYTSGSDLAVKACIAGLALLKKGDRGSWR